MIPKFAENRKFYLFLGAISVLTQLAVNLNGIVAFQ